MTNVTTDYCIDIIRKFEVSEENKAKNVLGIEGKIINILNFSFLHSVLVSYLLAKFLAKEIRRYEIIDDSNKIHNTHIISYKSNVMILVFLLLLQ